MSVDHHAFLRGRDGMCAICSSRLEYFLHPHPFTRIGGAASVACLCGLDRDAIQHGAELRRQYPIVQIPDLTQPEEVEAWLDS